MKNNEKPTVKDKSSQDFIRRNILHGLWMEWTKRNQTFSYCSTKPQSSNRYVICNKKELI